MAGVETTAVLAGYLALWALLGVYVLSTLFWSYELLLGATADTSPVAWDHDDIQVRILTIDAEEVVQETVDALPASLTDRHVVAETPIDVAGAEVHVVPDAFECTATDKGRALEWARRHVDCDREYVLYLDEDTRVRPFDGLPDADIVQFRERPVQSGGLLPFWAEVVRMGFQVEQRGFPRLGMPLYAWGGGIAVRKSLEDRVTWDYPTLIEDTVFAWRAVLGKGATFEVVDTKFENQAPPSLGELVEQRRRWLAGTAKQDRFLPSRYYLLFGVRNLAWILSPVAPFLVFFGGFLPGTLPLVGTFRTLSWALFAFTFVWVVRGWRYYDGPRPKDLPVLLLNPVIVAYHSLGALYGFLAPPDEFEPTEKVE